MTSWEQLNTEGIVVLENSSKQEIVALRKMAARDLQDASAVNISADARFAMAYSAARAATTIILRANGYRVKSGDGNHHLTFRAVESAEPTFAAHVMYFDRCRRKRNDIFYHSADVVSVTAAEELIAEASRFLLAVERWLKDHHAQLY